MGLNIIYLAGLLIAFLLATLIYWAGRAYLRRKRINAIVNSLKSSQFEAILAAIVDIGELQPTAAMLIKQPKLTETNVFSLFIPPFPKQCVGWEIYTF